MSGSSLRRSLGVGDAVTVGLGAMLGAGVFAAWAPAASAAGTGMLLAVVLAGAVATCNALSSAALAVRHPVAGGTYVYGRERLGPLWGYLAGWMFVVGKSASCAAMAMTAASHLAPGRERVAAVVSVVVVTGLNLLGVQRSAAVTRVVVSVTVAALLGVVVAALWADPATTAVEMASPAQPWGVLEGAGLFFFAFAGYARIATLAEEVTEPGRVIPRAVLVSLGVVLGLYLLLGASLLRVLGVDGIAGASAPVAELLAAAVPDDADLWSWGLRLVAGAAALGALLNLVLGVSRTTVAMARDAHLPRRLARVSGERGVPRAAELAVGVVVLVVVLVADLRGAIGFSSFGVLLYYGVANASALTLRGDWPGAPGVPALGLAGCVLLAVSLPTAAVLGGSGLLALGLVGWLLTGRRHAAG
ncbi:transporter [Serinicoccus sp. CUA-874]|uniref:APC family permease n=1 Tax=Serinicoccus sp. CUA-874 TaxID=1517939 RepID=UPI0009601663|nr:APC family permease [Serinicoccus sp. CUA-874]OLT15952.1 transporter [Serinicoccus sp. CUA-874]